MSIAKLLFEDEPWSPNWKPTPDILAWFRNFLRIMNEGSIWTAPGSQHIYKISHKNKTLTLTHGDPNDPKHWHDKNKKTLAELGYTVLDKEPPKDNPNEISLSASADQIVNNLLEANASPFEKTKVTLQYLPFTHRGSWKWHWTLLPEDKSKALEHGSADNRGLASTAARLAARKLGVTIGSVSILKPSNAI